MTNKERYAYCKEHHLCFNCGDPVTTGKSRCEWCLRKMYLNRTHNDGKKTKEELAIANAYLREWKRNNKDKPCMSKERKREYNRRYREKNPKCTFLNKERWLRWNGERIRLPDLSRKVGIPYSTMYRRLYKEGLSLSEAIIKG